MSVALSVAFTGLCALVSGGNGAPGEVLLVDAKGIGQVGGVTLPDHAPTLVLSLNDLANPETSGPTRVVASWPASSGGPAGRSGGVEQIGLWDLTGSEVRIRAQGIAGSGLQLYRPSNDESSWPQVPRDVDDPDAWRDMRFVPDMKSLVGDGRIDPSLLGSSDSVATSLPRAVAARVYLDSGLIAGDVPSQESFRASVFEFRKAESAPTVRQPLTDTMSWSLETGATAIVIDITPVSGGPTKRLLLPASATPHRVFISNLPSENPAHAHTATNDDDITAMHFGAYYKLLMNEPADRSLPELRRVEVARKGAGFLREHPCFGAQFTR
jgi:hypothetical protein